MQELALVERLRARVPALHRNGVVLGIGDDCAIFRPRGCLEDLLFTTDMLVEDVHFLRASHPPGALGHKALARGLSDIAAMGGKPRFCLLSLALPEWAGARWVDRFYDGLLALAGRTGTILAGGDLSRAAIFSCDIVVCGATPRGKALRRDGARPGDAIYVSGPLGGSALGLATHRGKAWQRHLRPEPRLDLKLRATACMDLSDGLSIDLHRLCLASGVAARISAPPRFPGATLDQALHGGEDYELLFTGRNAPRGCTRIGEIVAGAPGQIALDGHPLPPLGYDHFRL